MILAINTCAETIGVWQKVGMLLYVIKVIIPLILIIYSTIDIGMSITKNTEKEVPNLIKKTAFRLIAALIIFYVPIIVNSFISLANYKESKEFKNCSYCFTKPTSQECKNYLEEAEKIIKEDEVDLTDKTTLEGSIDTSSYSTSSGGTSGKLDFSYEGNVSVKSQFSSDTMKIVEKHMNDLNYDNFNQVISSYGGFENYAKSLGGVFAEYYGKELNITTEYEFQRVAEYIFGWMYMYGTDYCSGGGYHNWGGDESTHSADAFYSGSYRAPHCTSNFPSEFDDVISGTGTHQDLIIATECGPAAEAPLYKGGVLKAGEKPQVTYITRLQDLRPGDIMYFFDEPVGNKAIRSTWGRGRHNVLIGEVYDDRIVIYDGGSHFQATKNFKRTIGRPSTEAEEYAEVRKEFGFGGWAAERFNDGVIKHN